MVTKKHLHEDIKALQESLLKVFNLVCSQQELIDQLIEKAESQQEVIGLLLEKNGVELAVQPEKFILNEVQHSETTE